MSTKKGYFCGKSQLARKSVLLFGAKQLFLRKKATMMEVTIGKQARKKPVKVPGYLIYEVVKGKPIYYKGYKDVLNKTKTFEEIKMESILQSWLKAQLSAFLIFKLAGQGFEVTVGEMGINLSKTDKRGADISVFDAENFVLTEHFSNYPPRVILEIDISAEMEETTEMDYVLEKVADYHNFGVQKVIWVFTKNKKVMVAEAGQPWLTLDWSVDVEVVNGLVINLADIVAKKKM
jgi:Putative restriction endonuclease